ncbi:RNA polymerase II-binding domain-containing protein [Nemania serpens]|nr:RNA polymerase II-binding domain-containing protein [Nemania serpens]
MAYNDDAVLAKLSSLSETQDSIVSVAQWIMFYRRHADRTVQLWLQKLKDSSSHKRLNLIYLANEVAQQSKVRRKEEFLVSFAPAVAEAVAVAYKGAPHEVQQRIRRVVDVWRERGVFEGPIQQAVEARIQDLDKARGTTTKTGLSGSIFGSAPSLPTELTSLVTPQQNVSKVLVTTKPAIKSADTDYDTLMAPGSTVPSAPVYAARLSGLLKTLAQAEGAVEQCVKARRVLVNELQKLLDTNRNALIADENELENVIQKKIKVEDKKTEVERAIMAGLPNDEPYSTGNGQDDQPDAEMDRPEVEALTPPSNDEEEFEPEPNPVPEWSPEFPPENTHTAPIAQTLRTMDTMDSSYKSVATSSNGTKKRRLDDTNDFPDLGGDDGIDSDVAEMLRGST